MLLQLYSLELVAEYLENLELPYNTATCIDDFIPKITFFGYMVQVELGLKPLTYKLQEP